MSALSVALLVFGLSAVPTIGDSLDGQVARRFEFVMRKMLGLAPALNPKIKILVYDDDAAIADRTPIISSGSWSALLTAIEKAKPRAILIDQIFSLPPVDDADGQAMLRSFSAGSSVIVGAFAVKSPIRGRDLLSLESPIYDLNKISSEPLEKLHWLPVQPLLAYGPHPVFQSVLAGAGHIVYAGNGTVEPALRVTNDRLLPHLSFLSGIPLKVEANGFTVSGQHLPLNREGRIQVNLIEPSLFYAQARSLRNMLPKARAGMPLDSISPDDVVIILPNLYTGSTDFKDSPVGRIPGGLVQVSMMNSVLANNWLKPLNSVFILLLAMSIVGAICGAAFGTVLFGASIVVITAVSVAAGLLLFSFYGLIIPWHWMSFGFLITGGVVFLQESRIRETKVMRLREALQGVIPPDKLNEILLDPETGKFEASEQVITLMFIDVVGFSIAAEKQKPQEAFKALKELWTDIVSIIHEHGGIVDRTIGDGLLCFFGYGYAADSKQRIVNHALQAVECAKDIQDRNVREAPARAASGKVVYPLRIGVNTAEVYIGDLGDSRRIDFTMIGHGVNTAQRLEAACESYRIMFGESTKEALTLSALGVGAFDMRLMSVKHHQQPSRAFELDPFRDDQPTLHNALKAYRDFAKIQRGVESRWEVKANQIVKVATPFGDGNLLDFSPSGLRVNLNCYLAVGMQLNFNLIFEDPHLNDVMRDRRVNPIAGEIRWGRSEAQGFMHGVMFKNIPEEHKVELFEVLQFCAQKAVSNPSA